jgi:hypothetical protein
MSGRFSKERESGCNHLDEGVWAGMLLITFWYCEIGLLPTVSAVSPFKPKSFALVSGGPWR